MHPDDRTDRHILPSYTDPGKGTPGTDARRTAKAAPRLPGLPAPAAAPNVVVIVIDDMGFGGSSAFGGPCPMPTAERLAADGLRFTRFHVNALCSPTRQSLLTGRNHHAVGMGSITEYATSEPGYTSVRPASACTLAQVLRGNGYSTAAFGKMHQTPSWETGPLGPFDRWPTSEGFERFYGFVGAEMNHWDPLLYEGVTPIQPNEPRREGYHLTSDLADKAIEWLHLQRTVSPEKPFFLYFAPGACHAPLHVSEARRARFRGAFAHGWSRQRDITLARQKAIGVVPPDTQLAPWVGDLPEWDELSELERQNAEAFMETYAAVAEFTDEQVGRVVDTVSDLGLLEDTLVIYLLGDNGASSEGGFNGTLNAERIYSGIVESPEYIGEHLEDLGTPRSYPLHPAGWAHAMCTPYQWSKQVASHFGGTRDGLVVHWPGGFTARGEMRAQWHHVIDIMPTILDAAGVPLPALYEGVTQQALDGVSMRYAFDDASARDRRATQYFEMHGNRAIYHEGWIASVKHRTPWELTGDAPPDFATERWSLYDLANDWSQGVDVADAHPERLEAMKQLFIVEAARNKVFPLDDRMAERGVPELAPRPNPLAGKTAMRLHRGAGRLPEDTVLDIKNRSHRVRARVTGDSTSQGVVVTQGSRFGGWSLHLDSGRPIYTYNYFGLEETDIVARSVLSPGEHDLEVLFRYDGGGRGEGADIELLIDGERMAQGRLDRTVPYTFSFTEGLDVGTSHGTPVSRRYDEADPRFTGEVRWVDLLLTDPTETEAMAAHGLRARLVAAS